MTDDDSVFDRVRRTVSGPTPAEQAETLAERAREDPTALDDADVESLIELLDTDDPDVVGDALGALKSLADERPSLVEPALSSVAGGLSERPETEWYSTTLGDASQSFLNDLSRGSILLWVAKEKPEALDPVVEDLVERYDADTIDPMSLLALASVVADAPERVDVPPAPLVELVADALRGAVEPADGSGDDWENVSLQPMATTGYIDLLSSFDAAALDDDAIEDRRDALETARTKSDDEEVVDAAAAALSADG
ncbi:hypothetical protein [Halobellus ordinarius]|uniref:hypothetical protein n=1 Tax=Halobellus ordinarius TaxID=3075120 RepID=UPI0028806024|nr:hypothetical protein [Halobellus sp. ZY16]